ncbi:MAG: hypothetical protein ABJC26_17215 [Gemmatimonadaceae bacterium]
MHMLSSQKSLVSRSAARITTFITVFVATAAFIACSDNKTSTEPTPAPGFLGGIASNREIGVVVNSTGKALTMFQLGSPTTTVSIPLGTSSSITPVGFSLQKRLAAVPLGNAASVAIVNLETATIQKFFTFASGNATGSAWANDTTVFVANTTTNQVGRFYTTQTSAVISSLDSVAPGPTAIAYTGGRVLVVSGNLDANYAPIGNGIVTAINPTTMAVLGTVQTGGANSSDAAVGPDGYLYVLNTDYAAQSTMTIINPATMTVITNITNVGVGAGQITIDASGLAYISGFSTGTIIFNTKTRTFVRATGNEVCAKVAVTGACRGAAAAAASSSGKLYQTFFGSASQGQSPYVFVYSPSTYALSDSIAVGVGPLSIVINTFN